MTRETPEQVPEAQELQERPADEGLLETSVSVVSRPVPTLGRLTSSPKVGWAVVVTLVIAVASSIITAVRPETTVAPQLPSQPGFRTEGMVETLGVVFAILGPLFALGFLAVWTAILLGTSRLLGGRGGYAGLFTGLAFAGVPNVFSVPAQLLPLALGTAGGVLAGLVSFGIGIWVFVLGILAVRENNDFSTGRAVGAVLIPIGVLILVGVIFAVVVIAMFASSVSGQG
jgi:hypothetical protein